MSRATALFLILVFFSFALFTSPIWISMLIASSPAIIVTFCLIYFTRLRKPAKTVFDFLFVQLVDKNECLWDLIYHFLTFIYPLSTSAFLNYGYAPLNENGRMISLSTEDEEQNRMALQLYHWAFTSCLEFENLNGLTVLEVSSGKGCGLAYVANSLQVERAIGIDISRSNVEISNRSFKQLRNIFFYHGSADLDTHSRTQKGLF